MSNVELRDRFFEILTFATLGVGISWYGLYAVWYVNYFAITDVSGGPGGSGMMFILFNLLISVGGAMNAGIHIFFASNDGGGKMESPIAYLLTIVWSVVVVYPAFGVSYDGSETAPGWNLELALFWSIAVAPSGITALGARALFTAIRLSCQAWRMISTKAIG